MMVGKLIHMYGTEQTDRQIGLGLFVVILFAVRCLLVAVSYVGL